MAADAAESARGDKQKESSTLNDVKIFITVTRRKGNYPTAALSDELGGKKAGRAMLGASHRNQIRLRVGYRAPSPSFFFFRLFARGSRVL